MGLYDCRRCAELPHLYDALGHSGVPALYPRNLVTDEDFAECPIRTLQRAAEVDPRLVAEVHRYRDEYLPLFEAGHLFVRGGILDQPARPMEGMRRLVTLKRAMQAKHADITREREKES